MAIQFIHKDFFSQTSLNHGSMILITDLFNSSCDLRSWRGRYKGVEDGICGQGIYGYGTRALRVTELLVCKMGVCMRESVYFFWGRL